MKRFFYKIYAVLGFPALAVHELLHIVAMASTFTKIKGFRYGWRNTSFTFGIVKPKSRNHFTEIIISLSPVLTYFVLIALSFYSSIALGILVYFLVFPCGLPSKNDIDNVVHYKRRAKLFDKFAEFEYDCMVNSKC